MNHQLLQYITFARGRKMSDTDIHDNLVGAGWDEVQVTAALKAGDSAQLMPPPPPAVATAGTVVHPSSGLGAPSGLPVTGSDPRPVAVVQQRSTRGFEYVIMFIALGVTAVSLGELLHNLVDMMYGNSSGVDGLVSFATSAVIVALPIFALLFIRLKRAEQHEPNLRSDPSRRGALQLTLVVTFLWGLERLVTYVYSLLNGGSGDSLFGSGTPQPVANLLHTLITLAIAGGIFAYYWADEHRKGHD